MPISARLIVNPGALKLKRDVAQPLDRCARGRRGARDPRRSAHERPLARADAARARSRAPGFDRELDALIALRSRAGPGGRRRRGGDHRRRAQPRRCGACSSTRARFDGVAASRMAELAVDRAEMQRRVRRCRRRRARCARGGRRAHSRLPRAPEDGGLRVPRRRRHRARAAGHAARPRRALRAGRQGRLSVVGADERDSGAGGRRGRDRDGRAHARRRAQPAGARRRARRRRDRGLHDRRRAGDRRARLRHRNDPRGRQDLRPGNAYVAAAKRRVFGAVGIDMVAGPSESPGHRRRDAPIPTGWRWTCSRRPSTTRWRRRSCSRPTRRCIDARRARARERLLGADAARGDHRRVARAARRADPQRATSTRRARSPTASRPSTSSSRSPIPTRCCRRSATPARSSSGTTRREALGDYCAGPEPRAADRRARRAFRRRSASTTSRSARACCAISRGGGAARSAPIAADARARRRTGGARALSAARLDGE